MQNVMDKISSRFDAVRKNEVIDFLENTFVPPQLKLVLDHPKFPVCLTFARHGIDKQWFLFEFSVLGKSYVWLPESGLDSPSYSSTLTNQQRRNIFLSKYAFVPLDKNEFICPSNWTTNGIRLMKIKSSEGVVSLDYCNVSGCKLRPNVSAVMMNEYGMWVWDCSDDYFNEYTKSERTVKGMFFDDHYVDYKYQYMSPNETRTWSFPECGKGKYLKFKKAKYLLIRVGDINYKFTETIKL